jgi:hypothetical protein
MTDISLYLNFVLNAVLGHLGHADAIMRDYGGSVRRVATALRARYPFEPSPIHRGIALDSAFDPTGREFVSWSENHQVAQWFADPRSMMNKYLRIARPKSIGYVLTAAVVDQPLVLFHYSWARLENFPRLALQHPAMGVEGARQIAWSLSTQREVITDPPTSWPVLEQLDSHERRQLDDKFAPPWVDDGDDNDFDFAYAMGAAGV